MGDNAINYLGHVKMMSAVQPFLSGAISKTINMPEDVSVEDVEQLHLDAWQMGLKAVAVYRDNCKVAQPLSMAKKEVPVEMAAVIPAAATAIAEALDNKIVVKGTVRRKLPRVRKSRTYHFEIADLDGYFTVGEYDDGMPGELFVSISKQGSTLSGLMDSFAISVSHGLQYGVPLKSYVKTLRGTSFAPAGITDDPDIRTASSITDYIVRRLALDYLSFDDRLELGLASIEDMPVDQTTLLDEQSVDETQPVDDQSSSDKVPADVPSPKTAAAKVESLAPATLKGSADDAAPICYNCGNQTQRAGSCYVCSSCGSTTGCS
jgi:ribonucleoside-diphosphate reductase alpha chain